MRPKSLPLSVRVSSGPSRPAAPLPDRPPRDESRVTRWLATLPILLLVPAIVIPLLMVAARSPSLSLEGGVFVEPGAVVVIQGKAFAANAVVAFAWDDQPVGWLPNTQTSESGSFTAQAKLPAKVTPGQHRLTAVAESAIGDPGSANPGGNGNGQSNGNEKHEARSAAQTSATLTIEVVAPQPTSTATPVPATPEPTAIVTPAPATPSPSASVKPSASSQPSSTPVATPQPSSGSGSSADLQVVGFGAGTTGGRGGRLYEVSSWAEFRTAVLASGPRIVEITGSANIDGGGERLVVEHGDLTIDGSRWSGALKRYSLVLRASNVIVTQLRLRPGDQIDDFNEGDGLTINPDTTSSLSHIVIDHCSVLWGTDVTLAVLNSVSDMTIQHSIIAAGLYHSAKPGPTSGYGLNVTVPGNSSASQFARRITVYRNYLADNDHRNLRGLGTLGIEYVNNVFYNWGGDLGHANPQAMNVVGNIFRKGPNTPSSDQVYRTQAKLAFPDPFANSVWWDDNLGLGFTPTMDFGSGVRRSSPWDGGLHGVAAAAPSRALADDIVSQAGPTLVDAVDAHFKHDWAASAGDFYNGAGYPAPNPYWP